MGCCLPQHEGNFLEDQPFANAVAECVNEISVDIEGRLKKLCRGVSCLQSLCTRAPTLLTTLSVQILPQALTEALTSQRNC